MRRKFNYQHTIEHANPLFRFSTPACVVQPEISAHDGYIVNGGRCPTVGVSGFVLGGGIGQFTRSFGMGCDTLKEITIVTADLSVVTVKDTDDPVSPEGKLFWALCGAGGGNFGVVVE